MGKKKMAWIAWTELTKPKAYGGLGFRDFQKYNEAALAKLSWRMFENSNSLLCRTLKGKYYPEGDILSCDYSAAISHGWRSVLAGRDLLVQNLGWIVGNGKDINIWYQPWLDHTKQKRPYGPAPEALVDLTVADLRVSMDGEWDIEKIRLILPQYEQEILSIKPSISNSPDKLVSLGTKSSTYSTKSGYYFASAQEENAEAVGVGGHNRWYQNVWNLKVAPKVKTFAWKTLKRALPVGERLVERHIDVDPQCKRCGTSESIIHLLFQCPFAQQVWHDAPLVLGIDVRGIVDLENAWNVLCLRPCLPPTGLVTSPLVPWIL